MVGPKENGGLDTPDFGIINKSLKVTWIKRLNESTPAASWSRIPIEYLKPVGACLLFQCNFGLKYLSIDLSPLVFLRRSSTSLARNKLS